MSGEPALTTLFPAPKRLPLAGSFVFAGKLKLKQKAELQSWLDALPEPNARVRNALRSHDVDVWPIAYRQIFLIWDESPDVQRAFAKIALGPFNPAMTGDEIAAAVEACDSDEELLDILRVSFDIKPNSDQPETNAPKADAARVPSQTSPQ